MTLGNPPTPSNGRESIPSHRELRYKTLTLERGHGYRVLLVFLEMRGTHHRGLLIEREGVVLAKGVIANFVRGLGLANVEMAMPPPPDSNAMMVLRLTGSDDEETLDRIVAGIRSFLKSHGFDSPAASADATL
jgi:hypothetical protein